jgi:hypothetical protein
LPLHDQRVPDLLRVVVMLRRGACAPLFRCGGMPTAHQKSGAKTEPRVYRFHLDLTAGPTHKVKTNLSRHQFCLMAAAPPGVPERDGGASVRRRRVSQHQACALRRPATPSPVRARADRGKTLHAAHPATTSIPARAPPLSRGVDFAARPLPPFYEFRHVPTGPGCRQRNAHCA